MHQLLESRKSPKGVIIHILATEPLAARKIYNRVKEQGFGIGYHAVYKVLKQLSAEGILVRIDKNYSINENWINEAKVFIESINNKGKVDPLKVFEETGYLSIKFDTQIEMGRFILKFVQNEVKNCNPKQMLINWNFMWTPSFLSKGEYETLNKLMSKLEWYILCKEKKPFDEWTIINYWGKMGAKIKYSFPYDIICIGDSVIQIHWPDDLKNEIEIIRNQDVEKTDVSTLYHAIVERKCEINVLIFKNKKIAEQIRREGIEEFKQKDKYDIFMNFDPIQSVGFDPNLKAFVLKEKDLSDFMAKGLSSIKKEFKLIVSYSDFRFLMMTKKPFEAFLDMIRRGVKMKIVLPQEFRRVDTFIRDMEGLIEKDHAILIKDFFDRMNDFKNLEIKFSNFEISNTFDIIDNDFCVLMAKISQQYEDRQIAKVIMKDKNSTKAFRDYFDSMWERPA